MGIFDVHGRPRLRHSAVSYIDELGTSIKLARFTQSDLEKVLDSHEWLYELLPIVTSENEFGQYLSFSDNIVIGVPLDESDGLTNGEIAHNLAFVLLARTARYQLELSRYGRILRGGFAIGNLYMSDRVVTGPAHLEAVLLEEHVATFPRVVVSASAVYALESGPDGLHPNWMPENALLVDADGLPFINYLSFVNFPDNQSRAAGDSIEITYSAHSQLIENRLGIESSPRIRAKYVWMAEYHNFVMTSSRWQDDAQWCVSAGLTDFESRHPRQFSFLSSP